MPWANLAWYSKALIPRKTDARIKVATIHSLASPALLDLADSRAMTTVTLEQISTKVLKKPISSSRWTSTGRGQAADPKRITMYTPIKAAKNMISVDRKSHIISLPLGSGKDGW